MTVSPQPWMANPLGAMQGGVIATIVGQACSLAGQLHTGPGQQYSLADLTVYYFRSPLVDDGALTVVTTADRIGRRLGTVSANMTGSNGVLFARAVANIGYN
jgi:acyl-coenzyme A thioesterase PaaI-like protein